MHACMVWSQGSVGCDLFFPHRRCEDRALKNQMHGVVTGKGQAYEGRQEDGREGGGRKEGRKEGSRLRQIRFVVFVFGGGVTVAALKTALSNFVPHPNLI